MNKIILFIIIILTNQIVEQMERCIGREWIEVEDELAQKGHQVLPLRRRTEIVGDLNIISILKSLCMLRLCMLSMLRLVKVAMYFKALC